MMTNHNSDHPDTKQLKDFATGALNDEESEVIELHLLNCQRCCQRISSSSSAEDPFESSIRKALMASDSETNSGLSNSGYRLLRSLSTKNHAVTNDTQAISDSPPSHFEPLAESDIPQRIGPFEVRELLGQGAFGVVWRGFDVRLQRDVAIKIPQLAGFGNQELKVRFLREARASACLEHPNILPVYESGNDGPLCYIASAYCSGPDLSKWLAKHGPPSVFLAAQIGADLAGALQHAHSRGVIHRDLKPANVLLEPMTSSQGISDFSFTPKITDFGLAKIQDDQTDPTRSRCLLGTAGYMPPEMASGDATSAGPTADVYSLGALLYELLTGQQPFCGPTEFETLRQVQYVEPTAPSRINPKIPSDLDVIVLTCLQKETARRYANAQMLEEDLRRFLSEVPIAARPVGAVERTWRWCRRNRIFAALCATIVTLFAILAIGGSFAVVNLARKQSVIERQLWDSYLTNARMTQSTTIGRRIDSLRAINKARDLMPALNHGEQEAIQLRNRAVAALSLSDLQVERKIQLPISSQTRQLAHDSRLARFAIFHPDGTIQIRSFRDNRTLASCQLPQGHPVRLDFSPDGKSISATFESDGKTRGYAWQLVKETNPPVELGTCHPHTPLEFAGDDRVIMVSDSQDRIEIHDLKTGSKRRDFDVGGAAGFKLSPSRTQIAIWDENAFSIYSFPFGKLEARFEIGEGLQEITTAAWSKDSQFLAVGGSDHAVYLFNLDEPQPRQATTLAGHEHWIESLFFASIDRLVTSDMGGKMKVWDLNSGSIVLETDGRHPAISSDGTRIAAQSGETLTRWQLLDDRVLRTGVFGLFPYEAYDAVAMRDGDVVVSCTSYGLDFWDVKSLQCACLIELSPAPTELIFASVNDVIAVCENRLFQYQISQSEQGEWMLGEVREIPIAEDPAAEALLCEVSDDGRHLIAAIGNAVSVFEKSKDGQGTYQQIANLNTPELSSIDVCSTGDWLVAASLHGVEQWEVRTGKRIQKITPLRSNAVKIGPQDKRMAIGCMNQTVLFGNDWEKSRPISKGELRVHDFEFSPDGRYLAVVHRDKNEISLYNLGDGRLVASIPTARARSWITFSRDSRYLIHQGRQFSIAFWDIKETTRQLSRFKLLD